MNRIDCSVWENVPKNTLVFNAVELDSRFTSNLRYDLYTIGDIKPYFRLHKKNRLRKGQLRTRGDFDRENMSSLQDSQQPVTWRLILIIHGTEKWIYQLNINVLDINDNIPTFSPTMVTITSWEGDSQNTNLDEFVIPTAKDADEEHNAVQEYLLEDDYRGLFRLDVNLNPVEDIVRLLSTRPLDREERPSYNLVLIARDGGNKNGTLNITLKLIDVNDNVPVVEATSYIVYSILWRTLVLYNLSLT